MRRDSEETFDEIVIGLGKQVAVGEITINVTGSRGNKNSTEIAKVEFLNNVYQEIIDELVTREKTMDPISLEYHPNQERILEELEMAQNLLNDENISKGVINIDVSILNDSLNLGQVNTWQSLGLAVKPGDNISIYVGTKVGREHSEFEVLFTQNYAESESWNSKITKIGVGKMIYKYKMVTLTWVLKKVEMYI